MPKNNISKITLTEMAKLKWLDRIKSARGEKTKWIEFHSFYYREMKWILKRGFIIIDMYDREITICDIIKNKETKLNLTIQEKNAIL